MNRTEDLRYKRIIGALPADRFSAPPPMTLVDWQHLRMDAMCGGNNGVQKVTNFAVSSTIQAPVGGIAASVILAVYPRDQGGVLTTSVVDDFVGSFFPGVYDIDFELTFGTTMTGLRQLWLQFQPVEVAAGVAIGFKAAGAPPILLFHGSASLSGHQHLLRGRKYFPVPWKIVVASGSFSWADADEATFNLNVDGVMPLDQVGAA